MPLKKYIYFFIFLLSGMYSCKKSYLDLNPHDQLSEGTFWKTPNDAQLGLTGCYHALTSSYFSMNNFPAWDALSDNAWAYNNTLNARTAMTQPLNSQTGGMVTDFYTNSYAQIAVFNYFLDNVGNVDAPATDISEWRAEALFLRSYFYFYLTEFYGDVPLVLHSYSLSDTLLLKSPQATVLDQVGKDLDTAISNLPDQAYTDGHVVRATAQFLKARTDLYSQQYQAAADLCNTIMQSGHFSLYPDYYNMFVNAGQGVDNTEILFSVRYLAPNFLNNSAQMYGWWMGILPFQNLVDEYEMTDGQPISSSSLYDPTHPYANRDPRLTATIMVPGSAYGFPDQSQQNWSDRIQYITPPLQYNLRKYVDSTITTALWDKCDNDILLMRYADVLLTYAESRNEATGPDQGVYDDINQVRDRVNMPALPTGLSQDDMRTRIRHERRVEFAFEGQRWLDLKRWGQLSARINSITTDQSPVSYIFQPNNDLWPFPQSEIDYYHAHKLELGQNTGY
ncbi:MAG TPA: RagB/SusD family nutrient uptake outer membrane protein [Puia sp.]|nr:RagB/SusD family nutrient uptake outer membrane protein [Puia sp.]